MCDCTDFVKTLLLLGGDIESDPVSYTDLIMEQLRVMSRDIQEIKDEKSKISEPLMVIKKKLDNTSLFNEKV